MIADEPKQLAAFTEEFLKPNPKAAPASQSGAFMAGDGRAYVQLPGNNRLLSDFARELGAVLKEKNVFRRAGIVFVPNGTGDGLEPMTPDKLRSWLEEYAICFKILKQEVNGTVFRTNHTMSTADAIGVLAAQQFIEQLRPIEKFNTVRMPVKDQHGRLKLLALGYDEYSRTFTADNEVPIDEDMPGETAKGIIDTLLAEFPFADNGRSKSVALSAMLTVFGQGILPQKTLRPSFFYIANAEGAGKSVLVKCATVPVLGCAPTSSKSKDEDEMRKLLLSAVVEAKSVLFLDNEQGRLASQSLEGFLTSQNWSGRLLGANKTFTGENNVTVFVTGNKCTISPDMRRRSLICELFMQDEHSEDRVFKRQLEVPELLKLRNKILSALFAFIRDWHKNGEPKPSRSHASFPEWTNVIAGIVEHAGYVCPVETAHIEAAADIDGENMRALVKSLGADTLEKSMTFAEIAKSAQELGLFERIVAEDGELDTKSRSMLSKLLGGYNRRIVCGYRFSVEGQGHKRRYKVAKEIA